LETNYPSVTTWHYIGQYYNLNIISFSNVNVGSVPHPNPISKDYYSIGVVVAKNGGSPIYYNSSVASVTPIDAYNTRFDPITNPIEVKIP
jgi:hypothetical protein